MERFILAILLCLSTTVHAGVRIHPTKAGDDAINYNGVTSGLHAGDTIALNVSQNPYGQLTFTNCYGAPGDSIVFINEGGQVQITSNLTGSNGFKMVNCRYWKIISKDGIGTYGFFIAGTLSGYMHGVGIEVTGRSKGFNISGIYTWGKASGIWAKQECACVDSLRFPNWIIDSFRIHHNKVHNMSLEGMYIISTGIQDTNRFAICSGDTIYNKGSLAQMQPRGGNCDIDSNEVDSTGRGGIQCSALENGKNKIYNNVVKHSGYEYNTDQGNNISIGNGSRNVEVYNNTTDSSFASSIQVFGNGLIYIHNNAFGKAGNLNGHVYPYLVPGALNDSRNEPTPTPGLGGSYKFQFKYVNNTFGTNSDVDMRFNNLRNKYSDTGNIICNSGSYSVAAGIHYSTDCPVLLEILDTIALPVSGTTKANNLEISNSLKIRGSKATGISNDSLYRPLDSTRLVQEKFLNNYIESKTKPTSTLTITYNSTTDTNIYVEKTAAASIAVNLNWTAGKQEYTDSLRSVTVGDVAQTITQPTNPGSISGTVSKTVTANMDTHFTNVVVDKDGNNVTASANVYFQNKWFYGFATSNVFTNNLVQGLNNFFSTSATADGRTLYMGTLASAKYAWLAFDAGLDASNLLRIIIHGFDQTDQFTRSTVSFTNASGYTTNYIVYVSNVPTSTTYTMKLELLTTNNAVADVFKMGVNQAFTDKVLQRLIADTTTAKFTAFASFFNQYHVDHWRYPGGTPTRYYIWDDTTSKNLTGKAIGRLSDYYYATDRPDKAADYANRSIKFDTANFKQYVRFMKQTGVKPLITLNTLFYRDADTVYPVSLFLAKNSVDEIDMGLQPDRWTKIYANVKAEIDYVHSQIAGNLYWEMGNESYAIQGASSYGDVVIRLTNMIKFYYPNDKIIVAFSKGSFKNEKKVKWNTDFITYMQGNNFLNKVDYWAVHYYYDVDSAFTNQDSINKKMQDNFFNSSYIAETKTYFPNGYTPKIFLTEFTPLLSTDSYNFNTQLNAMWLFDILMKFHSNSIVAGCTKHTGTGQKNALWWDSSLVASLPYVDTSLNDSPVFKYISPTAKAEQIFFDSTGTDVVNFFLNTNYEALLTKNTTNLIFQVLNYNDVSKSFDLSSYTGTKSYTTYVMDDLSNHYWNIITNKTTGTATNTLTLPAHSFTTIIMSL